ncbi:C40 family peptidase [Apibacter raozihei]|uniref:C40 family peptidase n=1 Tax=Apibacter raozihei TaxID=2500547 RepID=UPI000FE369A8|nr:C40 family peptidase [Apibacter raozihei]
MRSVFKLFTVLFIVSATTTSCVSNYVVSNNSYKYPSTNEFLLVHNFGSRAKGPNVAKVDEKALISDNSLVSDNSLIENINIYAEKSFTKEAYNLITEAKTYLGTPYRYGGTTRNGIDCSSFVQHVFDAFDISLPRTSAMQSQQGTWISKEELKKGDLIFFAHTPKSRVSHVGIVESVSPSGEIFFIHASSSQGVTISSLDMAYWKKRFRAGKRVLKEIEDNQINTEAQQDDIRFVKATF